MKLASPLDGLSVAEVRSTIDGLVAQLSIGGFLHRWASPTCSHRELPTGALEGAFIPLMFWLATALALDGKLEAAERALARGETAANELGLFSEEVDARDGSALGNFPLLFSHSEHLRAKMALAGARLK